jgi:hypothetical protein
MKVANTLAYYDTATATAVKSFSVRGSLQQQHPRLVHLKVGKVYAQRQNGGLVIPSSMVLVQLLGVKIVYKLCLAAYQPTVSTDRVPNQFPKALIEILASPSPSNSL